VRCVIAAAARLLRRQDLCQLMRRLMREACSADTVALFRTHNALRLTGTSSITL